MGPSISLPWPSDRWLGFAKSPTSLAITLAATGSSPRLGWGTDSSIFSIFFLFPNGFPEFQLWSPFGVRVRRKKESFLNKIAKSVWFRIVFLKTWPFKNVQKFMFSNQRPCKIGKYILIFFFFLNLVVLRYGNGCACVGVGNGVVEWVLELNCGISLVVICVMVYFVIFWVVW
jgi:hypothetical protein